jgi:hypothetical protein
MKKTINVFLGGVLCGVIMAAVATFTLAIPGNNNHWRAEIFDRGGAAWSIDKDGHYHWRWTVQPISDLHHVHHAPLIVIPRSQPSPDSSRGEL